MPQLTRRRSDNPHHAVWHVYFGDVRVGTIGERAGVPVDVDQWQWSCGFYPGLHPGQHRHGTVATFAEARAGFEADWRSLLPEILKVLSRNGAIIRRGPRGNMPCGSAAKSCRRRHRRQ
jgi:hypothetical protein